MPRIDETERVRLLVHRGGTPSELAEFLLDLERAYSALFALESWSEQLPDRLRRGPGWLSLGYDVLAPPRMRPSDVLPELALVVTRIEVGSPGFWEVLGSLNPLEQLRKYLNDRHERRKDREYRESAEAQRLNLDNQLIQAQVFEAQDKAVMGRVAVLRNLGFSDEEIRQLVWSAVGPELSALGRHQDTGLLGPAQKHDELDK